MSNEVFSCNISCNGLYADVQHESTDAKNVEIFNMIQKSYKAYKNSFAQNIEFYQDSYSEVDLSTLDHYIYDNAYVKEYPDLIFVDIFFNTATYDEIKRDVKVTHRAQTLGSYQTQVPWGPIYTWRCPKW